MPSKRKGSKRARGRAPRGRMMPANASRHDIKMPEPLFVPSMRTTTMQFSNVIFGMTNSSGVFAGYIPFDPSVTLTTFWSSAVLFNEWSTFANLWGEVKVLRFEASFAIQYIDDTKGDAPGPLMIASISSPIATTPVNYQQVADNGDAQMWNLVSDKSGSNRFHSVKMKQVAWAGVTTPNPGSSNGIVAGCPGSIITYGSGYAASVALVTCKVRGLYRFRTRI